MSDQSVIELTEHLTSGLIAIESTDYKFWIPVSISLIAIIVSIFTAIRSNSTLNKNFKQTTLQSIKGNIDSAKSQVESLGMEMASLK